MYFEETDSAGRLTEMAEDIKDGYIFAMYTDTILFEKWPLTDERKEDFRRKEDKLLEARVFSKEKEWRLFRSDIGKKNFILRLLEDTENMDYYDEEQYLDIDEKRSGTLFLNEQKVRATGGGIYSLPLFDYRNVKIKIRNYIAYYEETGQAYIRDWRLTDLFQEKRRNRIWDM